MAKLDSFWVNDDYFERRVWRPDGRFNLILGTVVVIVLVAIFSFANYYAGWVEFLPAVGKHSSGPVLAGWNVGPLGLFFGCFWLFRGVSQMIVLRLWGRCTKALRSGGERPQALAAAR